MEPFIGQIILFAGNFAPRGWAFCDGQVLPIASHTALFSIIGNTYGGDGQSTFALPDLRGRVPVQQGQGPGLSRYQLGEKKGTEAVTLTEAQLPAHAHQLQAIGEEASSDVARGNGISKARIYAEGTPEVQMRAGSIANTGGSQAHDNVQPVLALNFIIALEGLFPQRN